MRDGPAFELVQLLEERPYDHAANITRIITVIFAAPGFTRTEAYDRARHAVELYIDMAKRLPKDPA